MNTQLVEQILTIVFSVLGVIAGIKLIFDNENTVKEGIKFQKRHYGFSDNLIVTRVLVYILGAVVLLISSYVLLKNIYDHII